MKKPDDKIQVIYNENKIITVGEVPTEGKQIDGNLVITGKRSKIKAYFSDILEMDTKKIDEFELEGND